MKVLRLLAVLLSAVALLPVPSAANPQATDVQERVLPLIEAVYTDDARFGGIYFTQDGTVVVQHLRGTDIEPVRAVVPQGVSVQFREVERSHAELFRLGQTLTSVPGGVVVIAIDTPNNRIELSLAPSADRSLVESHLDQYGAAVEILEQRTEVYADNCNTRTDCTPWRGGIEIVRNDGGGACTWGFTGKRNAAIIMVTAGHCGVEGKKFKHNGNTIGSNGVAYNGLNPVNNNDQDVSRTVVNGQHTPLQKNRLYLSNSDKNYALTSERPYTQLAVGQIAYKSGKSTGTTSGTITAKGIWYRLAPNPYVPDCDNVIKLYPAVFGMRASYSSAGGDSGAPVYSGHQTGSGVHYPGTQLMGIHSGRSASGDRFFAVASNARLLLALDKWCFNDDCT